MLAFLIIVAYSKHLHIFLAPINVSAKRFPKALGPLPVMTSGGKPIDFEDPGEDDVFGRGKVEDFTWKGMLDFATCTECGRCQSPVPGVEHRQAAVAEAGDHGSAGPPVRQGPVPHRRQGDARGGRDRLRGATADGHDAHGVPESGFERVRGSGPEQAARPLVGHRRAGRGDRPGRAVGVHDVRGVRGAVPGRHRARRPHRRHAPLPGDDRVGVPLRAGGAVPEPGEQGQPVGAERPQPAGLDEEPRLRRPGLRRRAGRRRSEYLFWVGCAGAFDDRAQKTVRATAELLHRAGRRLRRARPGGDLHRRPGAAARATSSCSRCSPQQNVEVLNGVFEGREPGTRKIVTTCPHCFNTLGREYPQLDGHYEVVHHTQLLNRLVREGKLVPVAAPETARTSPTTTRATWAGTTRSTTTPRALVGARRARTLTEMPRHADRSMCCGAGGARMWMEEKIGQAGQPGPHRRGPRHPASDAGGEQGTIAIGCPFCRVMLTDGLTQAQGEGAGEDVEVQDVVPDAAGRGQARRAGHGRARADQQGRNRLTK